ncbi:hypothetical protein TVNIR_1267 [Thioalkalivibrio nitratireducens DSM 14787]|uniref:Uncharacterized protein n=1 Tax=Thioalkalivibrio nitratireducens (strain DSM 14787 / UNIQEM 213 / ALEN2) TaxID=1255043 RepID=L0DVB0_THIND|nr:hypothetical protein TVNIR_1267 [Thioalkalivibrio nitratireducens DSM 14787]
MEIGPGQSVDSPLPLEILGLVHVPAQHHVELRCRFPARRLGSRRRFSGHNAKLARASPA